MKYRWSLILFLIIGNLSVWTTVFWQAPSRYLTVSFLNVGQGDAILITAPNNNQVLIDGGPDNSVVRALGQAMPFFDHSLDLVMESHPDQDHIGGLPEVFRRYEVTGFIEPNFPAETSVYQNLKKLVKEERATEIVAQKGQKIILSPEVTMEILLAEPARRGPRGGKPDTNASSIVAKLTYASTSFLFMGDLPIKKENILASIEPTKIQADVLKIAHHGAKTSNSLFFLQKVRPQIAVISAGENNRYKHPSPETLSWLSQIKAKVLATKDLGTITLKSDGQTVGY